MILLTCKIYVIKKMKLKSEEFDMEQQKNMNL